jgi:FKBP-type peptidyl-prolyl cis-trans isomerase
MNNLKLTVYVTLLWMLAASCAKEVSENRDDLEQRYIEAYINTNYPGKTPNESGLYVLSREENPLGTRPADNDLAYIRYTRRTLAENIAETSVDSLALMLGAHSYTVYYGPKLFSTVEGATLLGIREALLGMRTGEKARILMPSKLSSTGLSDARLYDTPMLYDLELLRTVTDIATFQTDSLKAYRDKHYPGLDTLHPNLYFALLKDSLGTAPAAEDTVKVRYVGALLDGFVFDTNIEDTAKFYYKKNFDKTVSYTNALSVIIKEEITSMDVVQGFAYALKQMKEGEEAVVFFSSDYGYQATTSGQIQPYSMLRFYIKVEHIGKP